MAHLTMELPETYASISRPVAYDIVKQLLSKMAVDHPIPIYFPGANGKISTWNSNAIQSQDAANFNSKEHVRVQVKEDYNEDDLLTMHTRQEYNPVIFSDPTTHTTLRPIYSRTKVTVNLQYKSRDRFQAESFRDHWRRKIAENREYMTFTAKYTYPIPQGMVDAIHLIYLTRLNRLKEFDTFERYLEWYSTEAITLLTNTAGKGDTVAVEETQTMIYGHFTDVAPPEADKDDKGSVWTVSFDFEYTYDKVISVDLKYPILVQNHLVPHPLHPEPMFDLNTLNSKLMVTRDWQFYIQRYLGYLNNVGGAYLRIPEFDDWKNDIKYQDYTPILSVMITVDEENPKEIFNLTDMGEYKLIPVMKDSFQKHHLYLNLPYETVFLIQLYKDDHVLPPEELYIDSELNIRSKYDLDPGSMYHIVISCLDQIRLLSKEAEKRFFKDPQTVYSWIDIRYGRVPGVNHPIQTKSTLPEGKYEDILRERQISLEMRKDKQNLYSGYNTNDGRKGYNTEAMDPEQGVYNDGGRAIYKRPDGSYTTRPQSLLDPYTPPHLNGYPRVLPNGEVDFREFREIMIRQNLSHDGNFAYHEPGKIMSTLCFFSVITRRNPNQG